MLARRGSVTNRASILATFQYGAQGGKKIGDISGHNVGISKQNGAKSTKLKGHSDSTRKQLRMRFTKENIIDKQNKERINLVGNFVQCFMLHQCQASFALPDTSVAFHCLFTC